MNKISNMDQDLDAWISSGFNLQMFPRQTMVAWLTGDVVSYPIPPQVEPEQPPETLPFHPIGSRIVFQPPWLSGAMLVKLQGCITVDVIDVMTSHNFSQSHSTPIPPFPVIFSKLLSLGPFITVGW